MDDLPRVGEKLLVLCAHGRGLLASLGYFKAVTEGEGPRPSLLADSVLGGLFQAMAKRFPDVASAPTLPGYPQFQSQNREILEGFDDFYNILLSCAEFRDSAYAMFSDCSRLTNFAPNLNADIMDLFIHLVDLYAKVHMLFSSCNERKLVISVYARAYSNANGTGEPSFSRLARYIQDYENTMEKIQDEFLTSNIAARVGSVLLHMKLSLDRAYAPIEQLHNPLNPIQLPQNIKRPSEEDLRFRDLVHASEIADLICMGFLVCPSELSKPGATDLWKQAISCGFFSDIHRGEVFSFHDEFEKVIMQSKAAQGLKNGKGLVADAIAAAIQSCGALHFSRRDYLRLQLGQLFHLLRDKPSVAAPKLSIIICLLGMAKDEICWYLRHFERNISMKTKVKPKEEEFRDVAFTQLMYYTLKVRALVLSQQNAISKYYSQYLRESYHGKLKSFMDESRGALDADETLKLHFNSSLELLANCKPESSMEAFRLNWIRLQVHLSLQSNVPMPLISKFFPLMNEICCRTRYVDVLESTLSDICGLSELHGYRAILTKNMQICLNSLTQSKYVNAYALAAQDFVNCVSDFAASEIYIVGPESSKFTEAVYQAAGKKVADLLHDIAMAHIEYTNWSLAERATVYLQHKDPKEQKKRDALPAPERPGSETSMRPTEAVRKLHSRKQIMKNLAGAFRDEEQVICFDSAFNPKRYILDTVCQRCKAYLSRVATVPPATPEESPSLRHPSVALAQVEAYLLAVRELDSSLNSPFSDALGDVLLEQIDLNLAKKHMQSAQQPVEAPSAQKQKKRAPAPAAPVEAAPFLITYIDWYANLMTRPPSGQFPIYSPLRKAFVGRGADTFCDISELKALCQLLGPNGLRYLEQRLLKQLSTYAGEIKELILRNQDNLKALKEEWHFEAKCNHWIKQLRGTEELIDKSIAVGVILSFRSLLAEALRSVISERIPHVFNIVDNAHQQYPANLFGVAGYVDIDALANSMGIFDNVDVPLRNALEIHCRDSGNDLRIWELLAYFYAAALPLLASRPDSVYNASLEALENNGHCLALCYDKLSVALLSLTASVQDSTMMELHHRKFLTVTATIFMRASKDAQRPKELESVVAVFYQFAQQSPFITSDTLNECFPYSLVRTTFSYLNRRNYRSSKRS